MSLFGSRIRGPMQPCGGKQGRYQTRSTGNTTLHDNWMAASQVDIGRDTMTFPRNPLQGYSGFRPGRTGEIGSPKIQDQDSRRVGAVQGCSHGYSATISDVNINPREKKFQTRYPRTVSEVTDPSRTAIRMGLPRTANPFDRDTAQKPTVERKVRHQLIDAEIWPERQAYQFRAASRVDKSSFAMKRAQRNAATAGAAAGPASMSRTEQRIHAELVATQRREQLLEAQRRRAVEVTAARWSGAPAPQRWVPQGPSFSESYQHASEASRRLRDVRLQCGGSVSGVSNGSGRSRVSRRSGNNSSNNSNNSRSPSRSPAKRSSSSRGRSTPRKAHHGSSPAAQVARGTVMYLNDIVSSRSMPVVDHKIGGGGVAAASGANMVDAENAAGRGGGSGGGTAADHAEPSDSWVEGEFEGALAAVRASAV